MKDDPRYLGDGVYAQWVGQDLVLYTTDGMVVTNRVVLEPQVLKKLMRYLEAL